MLPKNCAFLREWNHNGGEFRLFLFDTFKTDSLGKSVLAYRFFCCGTLVFEGADFCCSPLHAVDSDKTVATLLSFLSLKPGDTDREYFADYTPAQMEFAQEHGQELGMLAMELEEGTGETDENE